jgi:hypothetical protein
MGPVCGSPPSNHRRGILLELAALGDAVLEFVDHDEPPLAATGAVPERVCLGCSDRC